MTDKLFAQPVGQFSDGTPTRIEDKTLGTLHRCFCRTDGHNLYQPGSTLFRDEHESSTNVRVSVTRACLDRVVDLLHRTAARHAARRRIVCAATYDSPSVLR